ncbi:hypothetical protein SAY86_023022 [Trapa natans]|uniref:Uncharacterized protein n=1 Tax=Trapa natans TaxID=22666 RepID=A0AAN7R7I2_TRANT|nr:hypothetical protein SAY86_023022 [Trapa natans]
MVRCARCCLRASMKWVNVVVLLLGVGMIIYSLCLEKMWQEGISDLPSDTDIPRPWFILACLAVGIAVVLVTLFGHMIATCMSNSSLCIYLVTLSSLLCLESAVLVMIFFKIDWSKLISEYIGEHHKKLKKFVEFHVAMIRLIVFTVLVLQIIVVAFSIILWIIGTEPRHQILAVPDFKQSFLVGPIPAGPVEPFPVQNGQAPAIGPCTRCGDLCGRNPRVSLLSHAKNVILTRFRRTTDLTETD